MTCRGIRLIGTCAAVLTAGLGSTAGAATFQPPENPFCLKPGEPSPELYGPTDIGATTGNGRLSVAVNPQGTLSVFRWPSISFYEQLKYFTLDRGLPRLGLAPNEGAFSGLALELRGGDRELVWLRDLRATQRYRSADSDTILTRYRARRLGLQVEIADVVPSARDVLLRRHALRLEPGSPIRRATLIVFANLNPTASKRPLLPTEDWCEEVRGTDVARYDSDSDAIVYSIRERDMSTGRPSSAAVAIGADRASSGHQIGADRYADHPLAGSGPQSAYDDAADSELSASIAYGPAEVDAALAVPLGARPVTVSFAPGSGPDDALRRLAIGRRMGFGAASAAKRRSDLAWMRHAPLPTGAPTDVTRLAKRALVSLRQAIDQRAGRERDKVAIVASLASQSPYFLDWIRDGAFFNEALDVIGHHELVRRHNLFYAEVQHKPPLAPPGSPFTTCAGPTPSGNWFMTNYADGGDAGIFPWEIDEAAFGLWTIWRHYEWRRKRQLAGARAYLARVWPAIRRTAEFLVAFRDPRTGLPPGAACEDDNPPRPGQPTMHSAGPVLLAVRSALSAATALGLEEDAARYRARRDELEVAIETTYDSGGGAWTEDFGDGGWAIWPVRVKPYGHRRTKAQAEAAWRGIEPSFEAPNGERRRGQYEAKALLALARLYRRIDPARLARVRRGLRWIASVQAGYQGTGILGETWLVRDGEVISVVSQPHVWEQVLFYLAAIEAYGHGRYEPSAERRLLSAASAPRHR